MRARREERTRTSEVAVSMDGYHTIEMPTDAWELLLWKGDDAHGGDARGTIFDALTPRHAAGVQMPRDRPNRLATSRQRVLDYTVAQEARACVRDEVDERMIEERESWKRGEDKMDYDIDERLPQERRRTIKDPVNLSAQAQHDKVLSSVTNLGSRSIDRRDPHAAGQSRRRLLQDEAVMMSFSACRRFGGGL